MSKELTAVETQLRELEEQFNQMQDNYQELVTELNNLAKEQQAVKQKVERANSLYRNLSTELVRWEESSKSFKENMSCLTGDVLLCSGVLTYIGFFDHQQRENLQGDWRISVEEICLKYSPGLSFSEFLSKPKDRLMWQQQELPNDNLCLTNAIIMERYIRYPLVIDPSD